VAWQYLDLADFLLIAEAVLDVSAEDLARASRMDLADSALHAGEVDEDELCDWMRRRLA
jgi:hypothetical protein